MHEYQAFRTRSLERTVLVHDIVNVKSDNAELIAPDVVSCAHANYDMKIIHSKVDL